MDSSKTDDSHRWEDYPLDRGTKRRKLSLSSNLGEVSRHALFAGGLPQNEADATSEVVEDTCEDEKESISISAMSKHAEQNVAPFLAKHIPDQYAPVGTSSHTATGRRRDPNTKFCYRHRPDLKCRRPANEPSMEQLQNSLEDLVQDDRQAITHIWSIFSAAPAKQRNLILQGLLTQCCFPQLSFLSSEVRDLIRIDFISTLPAEIGFRILCFLDTKSLCNAAQVSQRWRILADDDVVWHRMCEQHIDRKCTKCGWGLPLLERKRLRETKRRIQLRATGRGLNEWSPNITPSVEQPAEAEPLHHSAGNVLSTNAAQGKDSNESYFRPRKRPWKEVYRDRFKIGTNWKYGRCNVKVFSGHQNGITCLQFDDRILATGSYDASIKIWDVNNTEEIRTLTGHTTAVRCLQFDDTKLISGSLDGKIKIWNWRTGECLSTLSGHNGGVIGLHFDAWKLASGSIDGTVRIWNFDDKSASVFRGHNDWVNSVKIDSASRTVFSASDDSTVRLWDLDNKTCIKTFEGHVGQVQQVVLLPRDFEFENSEDTHEHDDSCSDSRAASPAPQPTSNADAAPYGAGFTTCDRPRPPRYMLTSALDSTIRLWDTYTGKSLRTYFGHVEGVWALAADTLRVVSGAEDRTVKIWDMKGKCERTFGGHSGPVTCIGLSDSSMCSGGEDWTVRMYSF